MSPGCGQPTPDLRRATPGDAGRYAGDVAGPSRELYRSESVAVGTFRCRPGDAEFDGGWIDQPTLAFPRTCVKITQQGADTVVADPNTVVLYRGRQEYARARVDEAGDHCEWFEVDPGWLREAAAPFDPEVAAADAGTLDSCSPWPCHGLVSAVLPLSFSFGSVQARTRLHEVDEMGRGR